MIAQICKSISLFCFVLITYASENGTDISVNDNKTGGENITDIRVYGSKTILIQLSEKVMSELDFDDPLDINMQVDVIDLIKVMNRTNPQYVHVNGFINYMLFEVQDYIEVPKVYSFTLTPFLITLLITISMFMYYLCKRIALSVFVWYICKHDAEKRIRKKNAERVLEPLVTEIKKVSRFRRGTSNAIPKEFLQAWQHLRKMYEPLMGQGIKGAFPLDFSPTGETDEKKLMTVYCGDHPQWRVPVLTKAEREKLMRELERQRELEKRNAKKLHK